MSEVSVETLMTIQKQFTEFQEKFGNFKQGNEEKFGKLFVMVQRIEDNVSKTLAQAERTNGRVTRIEDVTVPAIRKEISEKPGLSACHDHKGKTESLEQVVGEFKTLLDAMSWLIKKPYRLVAVYFAAPVIVEFTSSKWDVIVAWAIKLL